MGTIEDAKQYLRDNFENGVDCPCCNQFVKLYNRKLHSVMAQMLVKLYRLDRIESGYHHVSEFMVTTSGTNDFSKLRYWGLVVERKHDGNSRQRTSGFWAITEKGKQFVRNEKTVPQHVKLFNAKSYGFGGEYVNIKQALGTGMNYAELMGEHHMAERNGTEQATIW